MEYKNLIIIGTSHIAKQSVQEVKEAIEDNKPAIVAVELDPNRYYSLKSAKKTKIRLKDIFTLGIVGFAFALLGKWAQEKLGKLVGVMPGTEMLTALRAAQKNNATIRLIDQDIFITLKRLSKEITLKEKLRFFLDILKSIFFRKREMRRLGIENLDLTKVPSKEVVKKLTKEFRKSYPNAYKVLVTERNHVMAKRLARIMEESLGKKIVAVVGAGHEEEIVALVKSYEKKEKITYSFSLVTE
ncbi:MAG TPA: TraB/GumN family protein [Candidatus Nanoarchaeia archaeon]|nr:TraB/GumN family protein [Candidatus Nanoarchaeia archaeon]